MRGPVAVPSAIAAPRSLRRRVAPVAAATLFGARLLARALRRGATSTRPEPPRTPTRFGINLPAGVGLSTNTLQRCSRCPSDGQRLDLLPGNFRGQNAPSRASPDQLSRCRFASRVALAACSSRQTANGSVDNDTTEGKPKKVRVSGGAPATVCDVPRAAGGFRAAWGSTGTIVFASANAPGLMRASPTRAACPEPLTKPAGATHANPTFLPDGRTVLFVEVRPANRTRLASSR